MDFHNTLKYKTQLPNSKQHCCPSLSEATRYTYLQLATWLLDEVLGLHAILHINATQEGINRTEHITEKYSLDIMHDLFEGKCHYIISKILILFEIVNKFYIVNILNSRNKLYDFEEAETDSTCQTNHIYKGKPNVSAREMQIFTHFFFHNFIIYTFAKLQSKSTVFCRFCVVNF